MNYFMVREDGSRVRISSEAGRAMPADNVVFFDVKTRCYIPLADVEKERESKKVKSAYPRVTKDMGRTVVLIDARTKIYVRPGRDPQSVINTYAK